MANEEITDYDIEQGKIVYEALKNMLPVESIKQMEYMVKNLGWQIAEAFMAPYKKSLPKQIDDLHTTALKYLHHKYQQDANDN